VSGRITDKDILDLFRDAEDPVLTAGDVADAFDISNQAANKRLSRLEREGDVIRKEVGAAAVVYWLSSPD